MFNDFFYLLRDKYRLPVSLPEWMTLHEALAANLADSSLETFYYMARAILIKHEENFDRYDLAFGEFFRGKEAPQDLIDKILAGMDKVDPLNLTDAEKALFDPLELEEIRQRFQDALDAGLFDHHSGGNKAIGTGGRSTHGADGFNESGVRIGQQESRHRRAIQIADRRMFRNYRSDLTLDTRSMKVALSRLRKLVPRGPEDELNLRETIDQTCKNAGELELVFEASKRWGADVLLLMDAGGSMSPYARLVDRLFSAARSLIHDLEHYYFHNCVYQDIYTDIQMQEVIPTQSIWQKYDRDYKVILVGDAAMAPSELLMQGGAIDYFYHNEVPGLNWLAGIKEHFSRCVWLNPDPPDRWHYTETVGMIGRLFPMYPLTVDGLEEAMTTLMK